MSVKDFMEQQDKIADLVNPKAMRDIERINDAITPKVMRDMERMAEMVAPATRFAEEMALTIKAMEALMPPPDTLKSIQDSLKLVNDNATGIAGATKAILESQRLTGIGEVAKALLDSHRIAGLDKITDVIPKFDFPKFANESVLGASFSKSLEAIDRSGIAGFTKAIENFKLHESPFGALTEKMNRIYNLSDSELEHRAHLGRIAELPVFEAKFPDIRPPLREVSNKHDETQAEVMHGQLVRRMEEFEARLADDEEIGAVFANFGSRVQIRITAIGYENPTMIEIIGETQEGEPWQVVQHVSQVSIGFVKQKPPEGVPPRRLLHVPQK